MDSSYGGVYQFTAGGSPSSVTFAVQGRNNIANFDERYTEYWINESEESKNY